MKRLILFALAVHCWCAAPAGASDFLLRLDTIGFDGQAKSDQVRDETVQFRMETIARPGMEFYSKVIIGAHTHLLHGELHPTDEGKFEVRIQYAHTTDTGTTVVTQRGVEPVLDEHKFSTLATATPGTPLTLAGLETKETTPAGEKTTVSLRRHVLILTEYEKPRTDAK